MPPVISEASGFVGSTNGGGRQMIQANISIRYKAAITMPSLPGTLKNLHDFSQIRQSFDDFLRESLVMFLKMA